MGGQGLLEVPVRTVALFGEVNQSFFPLFSKGARPGGDWRLGRAGDELVQARRGMPSRPEALVCFSGVRVERFRLGNFDWGGVRRGYGGSLLFGG